MNKYALLQQQRKIPRITLWDFFMLAFLLSWINHDKVKYYKNKLWRERKNEI